MQQSLQQKREQPRYIAQQVNEETDPFHMIRSLHQQQSELITPSPSASTPTCNESMQEGPQQINHVASGEIPKPQRERRQRYTATQNWT